MNVVEVPVSLLQQTLRDISLRGKSVLFLCPNVQGKGSTVTTTFIVVFN